MGAGQHILQAADPTPGPQVQRVPVGSALEVADAVPTVAGFENEAVAAAAAFHVIVAAIAGDDVVPFAAEQKVAAPAAHDCPPGRAVMLFMILSHAGALSMVAVGLDRNALKGCCFE
ncbi:hypothetical protein CRT60_00115 [Azospirillum palustre]|uniref:Uncharacterized protein n=1 Tax=Azospirillum palustre TaxID=2044885 RepID=A0A2B8BPM8_9PROT|nr:hypothetical protein CRT60_00115 [Azospirillum palustre]